MKCGGRAGTLASTNRRDAYWARRVRAGLADELVLLHETWNACEVHGEPVIMPRRGSRANDLQF